MRDSGTGCECAPLSSRERILAASVQVALREGVSAMTLDAVAREAGVSKGGCSTTSRPRTS